VAFTEVAFYSWEYKCLRPTWLMLPVCKKRRKLVL